MKPISLRFVQNLTVNMNLTSYSDLAYLAYCKLKWICRKHSNNLAQQVSSKFDSEHDFDVILRLSVPSLLQAEVDMLQAFK